MRKRILVYQRMILLCRLFFYSFYHVFGYCMVFMSEVYTIHCFDTDLKFCQGIEFPTTVPLLPNKEGQYIMELLCFVC